MALIDNLNAFWNMTAAANVTESDQHSTGNPLLCDTDVGSGSDGMGSFRTTAGIHILRANVPNTVLESAGSSWTISSWINFDDVNVAARNLIQSTQPSPSFAFRCGISNVGTTGDDEFKAQYEGGSGPVAVTHSAVAASADTWYHALARHDTTANTLKIRINNANEVTNSSADGSLQGDGGTFYLGSEVTGTIRFGPTAVWSRAISDAEATTVWNGGGFALYADLFGGGGGGGGGGTTVRASRAGSLIGSRLVGKLEGNWYGRNKPWYDSTRSGKRFNLVEEAIRAIQGRGRREAEAIRRNLPKAA